MVLPPCENNGVSVYVRYLVTVKITGRSRIYEKKYPARHQNLTKPTAQPVKDILPKSDQINRKLTAFSVNLNRKDIQCVNYSNVASRNVAINNILLSFSDSFNTELNKS